MPALPVTVATITIGQMPSSPPRALRLLPVLALPGLCQHVRAVCVTASPVLFLVWTFALLCPASMSSELKVYEGKERRKEEEEDRSRVTPKPGQLYSCTVELNFRVPYALGFLPFWTHPTFLVLFFLSYFIIIACWESVEEEERCIHLLDSTLKQRTALRVVPSEALSVLESVLGLLRNQELSLFTYKGKCIIWMQTVAVPIFDL